VIAVVFEMTPASSIDSGMAGFDLPIKLVE
jgi:hypothetical protein